MIIQFTGLSGSGKSTIAKAVQLQLQFNDIAAAIIDGDVYRKTVCRDLGFSKKDRMENMRRLSKIAFDLSDTNEVIIIAAINPYEEIRREIKELYNTNLVYINCDIKTLIERDTKGLYKRALLLESDPDKLFGLSGIDDAFHIPQFPELILNTDTETISESVDKLFKFICTKINTKSIA
ncbi:MAG TPA: adenylyl-sulfate kinase [Flavisolibacter sp.]|nr:adenylyl-sulfate kinase [Flavisolibacter sp.]